MSTGKDFSVKNYCHKHFKLYIISSSGQLNMHRLEHLYMELKIIIVIIKNVQIKFKKDKLKIIKK